MRKSVTALLASLPFAVSASGEVNPFIINGTDASVQNFPSIVNLYLDAFEYNQQYGSLFCGGTTLNESYVLTAAHCVDDRTDVHLFTKVVPQLQYRTDYPGNVTRHQVSEIYIHPGWNSNTSKNDIAILKLESPRNIDVNNVAIKRPTNKNYAASGTSFVTIGHGLTNDSTKTTSNTLQQTELTYVDAATCGSAFTNTTIDQTQLCTTGAFNPNTQRYNSACSGDSGGPVYINSGSKNIQVGITSFGHSTCGFLPQTTTVFTDVYEYRSWIDSVLAGSVSPSFTSTHDKRLAFFGGSTSSGGVIGIFALLGMFLFGFTRRK
ncbi:putative trypsin-like serine protease [Vibrio nigripulchritudo MADA3029]|uniref:S1 family peptidase n=1 Tax=Vibrio nigripulchritudo TaxID=28173 RepID=UPI0003B1F400|nr:serine protease [Vibrio nigripulchritudo]CCN45453.1 putative trypsin-like serine protease [Vibrio nigripulchritudo MADA3020]CCN56383.1 putative trypsin-like serine protease [Vibrio nigripulchritudo MADA3021]CCN57926.1 putative trypsin-like serine protease [Vibrio nigripulchritudo MADA3029]